MAKMDMFKLAVISAAAALLVACGGGGDAPVAAADTPVVAGAAMGVLTDSPIEGVEYTTSGGYTGLTDANGNYNYNPGETVTFKIGGITLGTVEATGTVTPLELSGGDANKATNLLVLFQSLDSDGDPSTKITITAAARTAAANLAGLDLTVAPATFASTGNTALTTLIAAAETTNTHPVSPEHALAHFKEQFMKSLRGGWVGIVDDSTVVLRFEEDGHYIMGETAAAPEGDGHPGIENGRITWNAATGVTSADVGFDGNGDWGLSSLTSDAKFRVDGDTLMVTEGTETFTFKRMPTTTASIVGVWTVGSSTEMSQPTFVFLPAREGATHTSYFMLDPSTHCGPGQEVGRYEAASGRLKVTSNNIDQNGDCGLWNGTSGLDAALSVSADGTTATLSFMEGEAPQELTLYRVGR